MKKIDAMDRYKRGQFLDHLYFYFLTVLTCSVFYGITSCLPYLTSLVKVVFLVCIPGFVSVLLSSNILFIIINLIILAIVVGSRIFSPHDYSSASTTHVQLYEEYVNGNQSQWPQIPTAQIKRSNKGEKNVAEKVKKKMKREEQNLVSASDELNKRADEFIARVLRQRRLELDHLKRDSFSSLEYN